MVGGAAQSLLEMLKGMTDRYVRSVVIIPEEGTIEERLKEIGIVYYIVNFSVGYGEIGLTTKEKEDKNFLENYSAAIQLQDIIKRENIQIIHINSSVSNVGAMAAIMAGIPYVWHFRELLEEDFNCEFWDKELKKELIQYADAVITISKFVQKSYKRKYNVNSVCIYDGVDTEKYRDNISEKFLDKDKNDFIITGNITDNKGQWDAVQAVNILVREGFKDIHLTIIGRSTKRILWVLNRYILDNSLEPYVTILPFQGDLSYYRMNSQYSLTTSKMEALGRCTIEAMLAGNLVIGANTGGTLELIGKDEKRGYLYCQGDSLSLANIMKKAILESNSTKKKCLRAAQEYACKTFNLKEYSNKIVQIYEKIISGETVLADENREKFLYLLYERFNRLEAISKAQKELGEGRSKVTATNSEYVLIQNSWERLTREGHSLKDYFINKNINKIAIYGMGSLGCKLYDEIISLPINIAYVVDQNPQYISKVIDVKKPDEELKNIDMLIIAVSKEEKKLVEHYRKKYNFITVGLSEIISSF